LLQQAQAAEAAGRLDEAAEKATAALALERRLFGAAHEELVDTLELLANLREAQGNYGAALEYRKRLLEIQLALHGKDHRHVTHARLAIEHTALLGWLSAERRAELLEAQWLYGAAVAYRKQILEMRIVLFGQDHWQVTDARLAIEHTALLARLSAAQRAELEEAFELNRRMAKLFEQGDYRAAVEAGKQAMEIRRRILGEEHPDYAQNLNDLGWLYYSMGEYAQAESLYRRALEIRKNILGGEHPDYAQSLDDLGWLYYHMGDYARAEPLLRQAVEVTRRVLDRAALVQSERQQLAMGQMLRYRLDSYLSLLVEMGGHHEQAFQQVLCWKGATLVRQRSYRQLADDPALGPLFRKLQRKAMQLASLARAYPQKAEQVESWKERLAALTAEKEQLEAELSRRSAAFARREEKITVAEVAASLPQGAVLVDYLEYDRHRPAELPAPSEESRGGIGAVVRSDEQGAIVVEEVLAQGAAARDRRLKAGDVIVAVGDGQGKWTSTAGLKFEEVVSLLRGPVGTKVSLRIRRAGRSQLEEITLTRTALRRQRRIGWQTERCLLAFVLRADGALRMVDLGESRTIGEAIDRWRITFGLSPQGMAAGRLLRQRLWEPLLPLIGEAEFVLVSPDGALGRLPLGALPGKEPGKYLLEEYRLALLPVPQLLPALVRQAGRKQVRRGLLLLGDVDYDADPGRASSGGEDRKSYLRPQDRSSRLLAVRGGCISSRCRPPGVRLRRSRRRFSTCSTFRRKR